MLLYENKRAGIQFGHHVLRSCKNKETIGKYKNRMFTYVYFLVWVASSCCPALCLVAEAEGLRLPSAGLEALSSRGESRCLQ